MTALLQTAVGWYTASAQPPHPHTDALFNLGPLFYDGDLVASDWQRSFGYFLEAAQFGSALNISSRSEEHTSELQSLIRSSYAVFCLTQNSTRLATEAGATRTTNL